jgi:hypothetical protein
MESVFGGCPLVVGSVVKIGGSAERGGGVGGGVDVGGGVARLKGSETAEELIDAACLPACLPAPAQIDLAGRRLHERPKLPKSQSNPPPPKQVEALATCKAYR